MGLFDTLFGGLRKPNVTGFYRLLDGYTPVFKSWSGGLYESQLVRAAIEAKARHISKLSVQIEGAGQPKLQTRLKYGPNQLQTWGQFLARLSTILDVKNTAFIVPGLGQYGEVLGIHLICPDSWELVEAEGVPWIRFSFKGGAEKAAMELSRVGIMTKFQYKSDLFGEDNSALRETLELIAIQNQGIEEAAKNSASYRFMARISNFSKTEDLKKERKRFDEANFQSGGGGILLFPNLYSDIKQLNWQNYSVDANQLKLIQGNVYSYFGVNEDILQNKAIGDAWSAFYEGAVEPFSIQLSDVLTRMLFTPLEQSYGCQIFFSANRLQYMSNNDKLRVSAEMADRGIMSINEIRQIWNLPPVEGGDVFIIRGEYYNANEKVNEDEGN